MPAILIGKDFSLLPSASPCVLCLGNFDGVHKAHAMLAESARQMAQELGVRAGAFCFTRPSGDYLCKDAPAHLTSTQERLSLLFDAGAEFALLAPFPELRDLSAEEFMTFLERYGCVGVVCGYDFRFGKKALGNADTLLAHFGAQRTVILPAQTMPDGRRIASSAIRELIVQGKVDQAALMLGRPWALRAKVCRGKHLGSSWGFPTANQYFSPKSALPARGVYAVRCTVDGKTYDGVANVGARPTVDASDARVNCETYLFDFEGDLYGKELHTAFYAFLRPEQKFANAQELRAAIAHDAKSARAYFENLT
ncbi:MAG: riboflavin biosynthesis protein RibF [Ruminococcaceae bacterium]|nr:riboflavin biosynthesis protein RibF [Oscillospiraceae bacterium]